MYTRVFALLWATVVVVLLAFGSLRQVPLSTALLAVGGIVLAFCGALYGWQQCPVGLLAWDGMCWSWCGQAGPGAMRVQEGRAVPVLDLQHLLLVQFTPLQGRVRWLWLERRSEPGFWGRLRCALMQPPIPAGGTRAGARAGASAGVAAP